MRLNINKIKRWLVGSISIFAICLGATTNGVYAEGQGISMSPPNQKIILNAGETYNGSFIISNSQNNSGAFKYKVSVKPFFVDEDYNIYYEKTEGINQIVDWTTLDTTEGILPLGESQRIGFSINVPENAPAGGQYLAIDVSSVNDPKVESESDNSIGTFINQNISMAHIVYAEIAGTTVRTGEILDASVPSFLFSGNITAESTIKNTGNTHGVAKYTLQIFPLFSDEEVYTNEEDPQTAVILPNRTLISTTTWENTPSIGIFNVIYTVEFEGITTQVSKMVIICPIWLLFLIIFIIAAIIIWLVMRICARGKKKTRKSEPAATTE